MTFLETNCLEYKILLLLRRKYELKENYVYELCNKQLKKLTTAWSVE